MDQESSEFSDYYYLEGERLIEYHFKIGFCPDQNELLIINLNEMDSYFSCGVYYRLFQDQKHVLSPSDSFRIGDIEFEAQKYNTELVSELGSRKTQEDRSCTVQDLRLDPDLIVSYLAVYDGHGGDHCSIFLKKHLHYQVKLQLQRRWKQIRASENIEYQVEQAILESFQLTDTMFKEKFLKNSN